MIFLRIAVFTLSFLLGISLMALYMASSRLVISERNLHSSEANARSAWGKFYDLEEKIGDEDFKETSGLRVRVWELEQKLRECK